MNFSTSGMTLWQREESYKNGNIVPLGTVCYEAGDHLSDTTENIVTEENQKQISMFWNALYFLDKDKADRKTQQAKAEYGDWLYSSFFR